MKDTRRKQLICIAEKDAATFQEKANALLASVIDPEIIIDHTQPFTMYALYSVSKKQPETILELLEMLDDKGRARCNDCPEFTRSSDGRKKTGSCGRSSDIVRSDASACEWYYRQRRRENEQLAAELQNTPFLIEQ